MLIMPKLGSEYIHDEFGRASFPQPRGLAFIQRPTQRAADGGYAPHFWSVFVALSLSRFDGESTLPPAAANAHRWLVPS